jgi:hypothetical protein
LLSIIIIFRLRDALDKVLREEQCGFRKARRSVDQIFALGLITEKCLNHQKPLIFSCVDYEQTFDSVHRRALAKVLSLYDITDKYIKVINSMYKNNTAVVKVGYKIRLRKEIRWFRIKSVVRQGCVIFPFIWTIVMYFFLRSTGKATGRLYWT